MRIHLVGPGRLGRSLHVLWSQRGHDVRLIGRDEALDPEADVLVLCVPDPAIAAVAARLTASCPVLHCSGATDLSPLAHLPEHGSLHPLMTFPGPELSLPDLEGVAAAIEGTPLARALATQLALDLGLRPVLVSGDRRLYHAAAVMAGNFATVLLAEAAAVLGRLQIPEDQAVRMLLPLALGSLRNAAPSPARALTGPAARGDHLTLARHVEALLQADLAGIAELHALLAGRALRLAGHGADTSGPPKVRELSTGVVADQDGV